MQTLLKKVTHIEKEAQDKIRRAKEIGQKELNDLLANEENAMATVRANAEKRASRIIQENIDIANKEIHALRQQGEGSIKAIHSVAEQNREIAAKKAWYILQDEIA